MGGGRQQRPLNRRAQAAGTDEGGCWRYHERGEARVPGALAARGPSGIVRVETIAQGPSPSTPHHHPLHHLHPTSAGHLSAVCSSQAQWRGGGVLHKGHSCDVPPRLALNRRAHHAMTNHLLCPPAACSLHPIHPPRSATLISRPPAPPSLPRAPPYHI